MVEKVSGLLHLSRDVKAYFTVLTIGDDLQVVSVSDRKVNAFGSVF